MPVLGKETPDVLRPYVSHGVNIDPRDGAEEAVGDCPFCGSDRKFYVNQKTGLWSCKVCGSGSAKGGGNAITFLRLLHEHSVRATKDYTEIAKDRGLLHSETPAAWGVCRSILTREWLVPAYNREGNVVQLYRYAVPPGGKGKRALLATAGLGHGLFGMDGYYASKKVVYVCEGPWDAMALWEVLRGTKRTPEGSLTLTANPAVSLAADANVVAVPGCSTFLDSWASAFPGKRVVLMYDNDHPKTNEATGVTVPPAGYEGMKRAAGVLAGAEEPPAEVHFLRWGEDGYWPALSSGTDVRDMLNAPNAGLRAAQLGPLLDMVAPIPEDWVKGRSPGAKKTGGLTIECVPCTKWADVVTAWRKAMKWIDGLDRALACALASVVSTRVVGDQLWFKIVGPASCGKSTLCEALSVNRAYVLAKSTIRGFHSGFDSSGKGEEDNSLIAQARDKTLVTKDGDTLLQSPNLGQILSEARDIFDRTSRTHYRNKMSKEYEGVNMTWLLCGTSSLRSLDSSELGERFLDCVIMDKIDPDLEDEILYRVAHRSERSCSLEANGKPESNDDPDMLRAKQLTGGYVGYLRENARRLLDGVVMPEGATRRCVAYGKFVAYFRARPSKKQDESVEREFGARLVSQMVRLAKCLAVVLNRKEVDAEVMRRVRTVALDTARGRTLEMARQLYEADREAGADPKSVIALANETDEAGAALLRFMGRVGIAEHFVRQIVPGVKGNRRWRLTERVHKLYAEVTTDGG